MDWSAANCLANIVQLTVMRVQCVFVVTPAY